MEYPIYSHYKIKGKPSWYYAVNNIARPFIPMKMINIYEFTKIGYVEITGENLLKK